MIQSLLLLALSVQAQDFRPLYRDDNVAEQVRELRSGAPTTTANATYRGTQTFLNNSTFQGRVAASTGAAVFLSTYSFSAIDPQNWTNTTYSSGCLTSSTNTVTVPGGMRVRAWLKMTASNNIGTTQIEIRLLRNGAVAHSADSIAGCLLSDAASPGLCDFVYQEVPGSGQFSYCIQALTPAGTITLPTDFDHQFGVETVP